MSTSGKRVYNKLYIHVSAVNTLDGTNASLLSEAAGLAKLSIDSDFNVARLSEDHHDVALLDYPRFLEDAFPALARSWRVHMPSGHVGFRDYRQSLNPPILHRKELLLPNDHPGHTHFAGVTRLAESIGLFDDTRSIGFLVPWATLVSNKGYRIEGAELLPIGNSEASIGSSIAAPIVEADEIQRHLTALTRTSLSAPVQSLLRHGLLRGDTSFFDYGCGKGDDLAGLASMGVSGGGWDPYYRPDAVRAEADVVNVGFVINVIEDFDERAEALTIAFSLCRQVMAVSAMLQSTGYSGRSYRDGVLTGRNTFQKYYSQTELQQFIETVVDESAIAAAPGVFYVFKDRGVENHFYSRRTVSRTRALRAALPPQPPRVPRIPTSTDRPVPAPDPRLLDAVSGLWQQSLELGRAPDLDEIEAPGRLTEAFGSIGRAVNYCNRWKDAAALERSGAARRDELRVFFALQVFSKRRKFP
ncbi:MAG: DNA phosphorothioation-associated putative methyltransferase, partial [Verrucomicrobiota bacterium]